MAQRWQRTLGAFEEASDKSSATHAFFAAHRTVVQREAEFGKASHTPVGAWTVLASLDRFLLVVFGHEEVDYLGHGSAETLIRHVDREVERLARMIRKLHHWGYPEVHVVTDHGFILLDEDRLPPEVRCEKDWCYLRKERFALVPASADVPLTTLP